MTGNGLGQGLSDMWRSVLLFVPEALAFVAILVVGYVVARLLRTAVRKGLHRAGFDRVVDRGTLGRALRAGKVGASDLCGKLAFYAVLLFALQLAFGVFGPNPVSALLSSLIAWLPRAFVAIVVIVVAAAIASAVYDLIASALGGLAYGRVLARAASIVIVALGVIAALDQVQIATAVTQPLLIALLAMVAGVVIVGVGGGLIRPMQHRWDRWLDKASTESAAIREHAKAYADERARQAAEDERLRAVAEEEAEAERLRAAAEEAERRAAAEEAERRAAAEEAERRAAAEEAERRAAAEEAERRAAAEEAERRAAAEEAERRAAAEEAERRAAAEAEAQRRAAAASTTTVRMEPAQPVPPRITDTVVDLAPVDDYSNPVPGFDRREPAAPDDTMVIDAGAEDADRTQVIPPGETLGSPPAPGERTSRKRRPRSTGGRTD